MREEGNMSKKINAKLAKGLLLATILVLSVNLIACLETTAKTVKAAPEPTKQKSVAVASINKTIYTDQELWVAGLKEKQLKQPAFAFVNTNPSLPNVLLMGGVISVGYTHAVQQELADIANVYRIPANGGDTKSALKNLQKWLAGTHWDVIHFNWGMNDLKRKKKTESGETPPNRVKLEQYASNLDQIVTQLEKSAESLIWASTTIVPDSAKSRISGDEILYNQAALKVMEKHPTVEIDDLFSLSKDHPEDRKPKSVSFSKDGQKRQGVQVAKSIKTALDK
jgi:hypothetical protein